MRGSTEGVAHSAPAAGATSRSQGAVQNVVERRRKQFSFRIALAGIMLLFFHADAPPGWMVTLFFVYLLIQITEYGLAHRLYGRFSRQAADNLALVSMGLGSCVFGLPSLLWGLHNGLLGLLCGSYLLCGSMLNALLMTKGCRRAFIASAGPMLAYIVISGLLVVGRGWGLHAVTKVFVASGAMSLGAVKLWVDASRARQFELAAMDELEQREVQLAAAVEAADAANQAKGDFLANMSHEIRTPLNGVLGMADMLARSDLPARERNMAEIIRASGDTLQRLLSDILDMARIESGEITIETAPFHVGDMARAVAGLSQLKCEEKGVRLAVEIDGAVDRVFMGDMVRVRQVVTNLLSNAAKFTEAGEVRLEVRRGEGGRVRFAVRDTGVGFAMEAKAKVLGRFQQADNSITRRYGGTGLGLSICCNLAALMGGELDCESRPGAGSVFWMELPLEPAEALVDERTPAQADVAPSNRPLQVLLADDHATNRKVVELMLSGQGAELVSVEDGLQALAAWRQRDYDVVLMDMQMPVMDGLTAIRELRAGEAALGRPRVPVVMLTANAMPEHVTAAREAGADLYLAKPFTAPALFDVLEAALQIRSTSADLAA
jgi:signal transduction histidine kinase/AmiR/NasT family two-component response regulator